MSITIKHGATAYTPTGGTDLVLTQNGYRQADTVTFRDLAEADELMQRSLDIRQVQPAKAPRAGEYAKLGRKYATWRVPFVAADGTSYVQTVRVETSFHHEYPKADRTAHIMDAAAIVSDPELSAFWQDSVLPIAV